MTYTDPSTSTQDSLKARAQNEYDDARSRLYEGAQRLKTDAAPTLMNSVTGELERRKDGLSAELRSLAETLRHASDEQSGKDSIQASGLIGHGAQLVEDLSRGLEGRSVNEIGQSLSGYARGNPAVFIGGCLLAGLAIGRLLTASTPSMASTSYTGTPNAGTSHGGASSTGASTSYGTNPNTTTTPSSYATAATPSTATPSTTPASPYVSPKREDDDVVL